MIIIIINYNDHDNIEDNKMKKKIIRIKITILTIMKN